METLQQNGKRYTATCGYCARTIFREARLIGDLQLGMAEHHILVCRPLLAFERSSDVLRHLRIREVAV